MTSQDYRQLTLSDIEQAAQVLAQSFVEDPLVSFMLPARNTRIKTLLKFFRVYGEISIKNNRGFGVGEPLQGVAYWLSPDQEDVSISVNSLGKLLPFSLINVHPVLEPAWKLVRPICQANLGERLPRSEHQWRRRTLIDRHSRNRSYLRCRRF